jgi:hypothetical protein
MEVAYPRPPWLSGSFDPRNHPGVRRPRGRHHEGEWIRGRLDLRPDVRGRELSPHARRGAYSRRVLSYHPHTNLHILRENGSLRQRKRAGGGSPAAFSDLVPHRVPRLAPDCYCGR